MLGFGRAAFVTTQSQLSLAPQARSTLPSTSSNDSQIFGDSGNCGFVFHTSTSSPALGRIIDSRATNHMTFDQNDFLSTSLCRRTSFANANGVPYPVTRADTVALSSSLSLSNTLFVLSLCNKLMFVGEATKNWMKC